MASVFPEANLGFLLSAEGEVASLSDRVQLLGCTMLWILADDLAGRLLPPEVGTPQPCPSSKSSAVPLGPAGGADACSAVLHTDALLHCAAVCALVASAFGAVASPSRRQGGAWLLLWGTASIVLFGCCEQQVRFSWRQRVLPTTLFGLLQVALLALTSWTLWLVTMSLPCAGCLRALVGALDRETPFAPGEQPLMNGSESDGASSPTKSGLIHTFSSRLRW